MGTKLLLGFGGTVIQVVVHLLATGSEMLSRFGGTVIQVVVHLWILQFKYAIRFAIMAEFRTYRNPSSISPFWSGQHHMKRFGSTVIQVVVHHAAMGNTLTFSFGGTIN